MATDLSLINAALTRTGSAPVTNLDTDTTSGGQIAKQNYDEIVEAELAKYPWKFATKSGQLALIDADVHGAPPEPWVSAYQLPVDMLDIRAVTSAGLNLKYAVHGNTIVTSAAGDDDEVFASYIWRPAESAMPAWFREAIIVRLEALFLRGVGERFREAESRDEAAERALMRAKLRDSQSQTPREVFTSPTLEARRA
jgi:hypothetical protein